MSVPGELINASLREARNWLRTRLPDGARCPCCEQFAKVYKRKLNSGVAWTLIHVYRAAGTDWVDVLRAIPGAKHNGDMGSLRYWGLVEAGPGRNGIWRVTDRGARFARGEISVPSHALVYDGTLIRVEGDPLWIRDALGDRFDYDTLMATPGLLTERND